MDTESPDSEPQTLPTSTFVLLGATLALMGAVPAAFWLADSGLLPWSSEWQWTQLRREVTPSPSEFAEEDFVSLERQGCFGFCPVYEVRVFASGYVRFTGISFVCAKGLQVAQIEPALAGDLLHDLAAAGFAELTWTQGSLIADASSASVTLSRGDSRHRLENSHGDPNAPRVLRRMERAIDEVAGTQRWLPRYVGHDKVCELPDGSRRPIQELENAGS